MIINYSLYYKNNKGKAVRQEYPLSHFSIIRNISTSRLHLMYCKIGLFIIKYPLIVYFIVLLLIILINILAPLFIESKIYFKIPSIENIKAFFDYKTSIIKMNYNFNQYLQQHKASISIPIIPKVPLIPDSMYLVSVFGGNDNADFSEKQLNYNLPFNLNAINEYSPPPKFEVVNRDEIPPTKVLEKEILNKDLPFEETVEIVVPENVDHLQIVIHNILNQEIQKDTLNSIFAPAVIGPQIYNTDEIFNIHLNIIDIVTNIIDKEDIISQEQTINIIRNEVHNYLQNSGLLNSITMDDLKNSNHFINLLVCEFTSNFLFVYEKEQFIISNVCGSIIIETLCHVQRLNTADFYNDPDLYKQTIEVIMKRFIPS